MGGGPFLYALCFSSTLRINFAAAVLPLVVGLWVGRRLLRLAAAEEALQR